MKSTSRQKNRVQDIASKSVFTMDFGLVQLSSFALMNLFPASLYIKSVRNARNMVGPGDMFLVIPVPTVKEASLFVLFPSNTRDTFHRWSRS